MYQTRNGQSQWTASARQNARGQEPRKPLRTAAGKKEGPTAHGHFRSGAATVDKWLEHLTEKD